MANKKYTKEFLISELQIYYNEHNKIPVRKDFIKPKYTHYGHYERIFGSWNNAIKEAGFNTYNERQNTSHSSTNKKKYTVDKSKIFKNIGFTKNKYYNWYYGIINNAKSQSRIKSKTQYYENHHILPRSLGGDNDSNNLVLLTAREHFICHYLLCKMLPEQSHPWHSMIMAFNLMKGPPNKQNIRYFNARLYEYAKKHHSTTMSVSQSGEKILIITKSK